MGSPWPWHSQLPGTSICGAHFISTPSYHLNQLPPAPQCAHRRLKCFPPTAMHGAQLVRLPCPFTHDVTLQGKVRLRPERNRQRSCPQFRKAPVCTSRASAKSRGRMFSKILLWRTGPKECRGENAHMRLISLHHRATQVVLRT